MPTYTELRLADGTSVRFECVPGTGAPPAPAPEGAAAEPSAAPVPAPGGPPSGGVDDGPEGMGPSVPVARGGRRVAAFAVDTLRQTLRPLGPLLQEVHDAVLAVGRPPQEISVSFGLQVGQDLKLGIVGANGQAHMTVSATWQPQPDSGTGPRHGTDPQPDSGAPPQHGAPPQQGTSPGAAG